MFTRLLLIALVALSAACEDGGSTAASDAAVDVDRAPPPDSATDAEADAHADAAPRRGPGESCAPGQCARGACVNGVCSALCVRDADCDPEAPRCVGRGGAGRCSVPCEGLADCAPGLVCAAIDALGGICVAPGAGRAGDPCAGREDCASWFCAGDRCLGACDAAECPPGERCLPLTTQAVCTPAGDAPPEAPCAGPGDCVSGVCRGGRCADACPDGACPDDRTCLRYPVIQLCERRCADSADCGETGVCLLVGRERLCVTRGARAAGESCALDAECHSGVCALGQCAARCDDGACPPGTACVRDIAGATCRPIGPATVGARCEGGSLCATGFCGAGVCTVDCADDGPCPAGTRCTTFADGRFCFPVCDDDVDCAGPAFCEPRFAEGPTCFWRGAAAAGEGCADHRDCASGRCADGRCLASCLAECPAGQRCVDFGTGTFCAAAPLPVEAACDAGDTCAGETLCTAGRCLPACADGCPPGAVCRAGRCHPRCEADADCRPGRICDRFAGACIEPGAAAAGAICRAAADCEDGLCLDGRCRAACAALCGAGETCLALGDGRWCVPAGRGEPGAVCATGAACASGLCLGRRCAVPCDDDCPTGTRCQPGPGGVWCAGACDFETPCGPGEACARAPGALAGECVAQAPPIDACATDADCAAPAVTCREATDGRRCRPPCRDAADCAPGEGCAPLRADADAGICVPAGQGAPLDPCATGADCASGWCLADYLDGRCGARCATDADCPAGRCVDLARDPAAPRPSCAPACEDDDDCAPPTECRRGLDGRGACY